MDRIDVAQFNPAPFPADADGSLFFAMMGVTAHGWIRLQVRPVITADRITAEQKSERWQAAAC